MKSQSIWQMTKQTFSEYSDDNVPRLSAALAYYAIFAIAPLLVIAIAVAGFVWGQQAASGQVYTQLRSSMGDSGAQMVQTMVANASHTGAGILATAISVVILLIGASAAFVELQSGLDSIWEVQPKPMGIWGMIRQRLLSFAMVLVIGVLLLASLAATAVFSKVAGQFGGASSQWINNLVGLLVFTVLFAIIFKMLPDVKIRWRDVWIGAAITALLFTIGKYLIGLYLGHGGVSSIFGGAGSLVMILVWVYYSSQILFIGAEFTQVYSRRHGEEIQPADNAVRVQKVTREGEPAPQEGHPEYATDRGHIPQPAHPAAQPARPATPPRPIAPAADAAAGAQRSRFVPLLLGALVGRYLFAKPRPLSQDEARKMIRQRHMAHRHFAAARLIEPGWVSHKQVGRETLTQVKLPHPLYRAAERIRHAYRRAREQVA